MLRCNFTFLISLTTMTNVCFQFLLKGRKLEQNVLHAICEIQAQINDDIFYNSRNSDLHFLSFEWLFSKLIIVIDPVATTMSLS